MADGLVRKGTDRLRVMSLREGKRDRSAVKYLLHYTPRREICQEEKQIYCVRRASRRKPNVLDIHVGLTPRRSPTTARGDLTTPCEAPDRSNGSGRGPAHHSG